MARITEARASTIRQSQSPKNTQREAQPAFLCGTPTVGEERLLPNKSSQRLRRRGQGHLPPHLAGRIRESAIAPNTYPPETAGSIMSADFATVMEGMTVQQAIQKLREDQPSKNSIYHIYVVDKDGRMIGFVSLKDLIIAVTTDQVTSLLHKNFSYAYVTDDQECVAKKMEKHDLVAIPILDETKQLLGIVSYDNAMDIIRAEDTEDMEKFVGIVSNSENTTDYLKASSFQHFKKRVLWIVGLFMAGFLSEAIIHKYEFLLTHLTALALYLPMVAGAGGNAGSQAATVVIRAVSLGQVTLRDWLKIMLKEAKVAILLASCLFFVAFFKVVILSSNSALNDHSVYSLAFVIALALSLQVITSTVTGAALPLLAKYLNGDPAVAAHPVITTIMDITGVAIYFTIAMRLIA